MARKTRHKRFICLFAVLIIIAVIITAFCVLHHHKTYFTVDKWNASAWNDRQNLIRSFIKQYDLNRMSKDEIIDLLGNDTAYYYDYAIRYKTEDNLVYDFGEEKNSASWNITLIISFAENDFVSSYELKKYSQ